MIDDITTGFRPTPFPAVPIPAPTGLSATPVERPDSIFSILPALVVRLADLGGGQTLIGILRFERDEVTEKEITYGVGTSGEIGSLQNSLGRSLIDCFENGRAVESVSRCGREGGWRQLCWLTEIRRDPNCKPLMWDTSCLPAPVQFGLIKQVEQARTRREAVLALRKRWSLADCTSRAAIPSWLPKEYLQMVMDTAAYRELPAADETSSAPTSATPTRARR